MTGVMKGPIAQAAFMFFNGAVSSAVFTLLLINGARTVYAGFNQFEYPWRSPWYSYSHYLYVGRDGSLFLMLVSFTCTMTSLLLLGTVLSSIFSTVYMPKAGMYLAFHVLAFVTMVSAGITVLVQTTQFQLGQYKLLYAAGGVAIVNGILYLIGGILGYRFL